MFRAQDLLTDWQGREFSRKVITILFCTLFSDVCFKSITKLLYKRTDYGRNDQGCVPDFSGSCCRRHIFFFYKAFSVLYAVTI